MIYSGIMNEKNFVVIGDTIHENKYAYKIKHELLKNNYTVYSVGKEFTSLNEIQGPIDVIDLCIHPTKGLKLLQENKKKFKYLLIQPGADDPTLISWLEKNKISYIQGCMLIALNQKKK